MKKELVLEHIGIMVSGEATINLWGGGQGTIRMRPKMLFNEDVTKTNILSCINDGGFGSESIAYAEITIHDVYGDNRFQVYNRTIEVTNNIHLQHAFKGI